MVHIVALEVLLARITIHPSQKSQILALIQNEAPTKVPPKYVDYADFFFFELMMELIENISINKHVIKLQKNKQLPYRSIYNLGPVELETLKSYIKTHLKTEFI